MQATVQPEVRRGEPPTGKLRHWNTGALSKSSQGKDSREETEAQGGLSQQTSLGLEPPLLASMSLFLGVPEAFVDL